MMTKYWLNDFAIEDFIKSALKEDFYYGDITTDAVCQNIENPQFVVYLTTRADGVLCGRPIFEKIFEILAKDDVKVDFYFSDGDFIKKGDKIAKISGDARYILTGERLALNFVQKLSGIATYTRKFQSLVDKYGVRVVDTRKNTPNFRLFEKYAVKVGGNYLHRFNLSYCVMLKDNHIALLGGSITNAVECIRKNLSHAHKIEVECDTLEQVKEALDCNVDIIMLDNMTPQQVAVCKKEIAGRAIIEVSGGVNKDNLEAYCQAGPDVISMGALTHSVPAKDLSLKIVQYIR